MTNRARQLLLALAGVAISGVALAVVVGSVDVRAAGAALTRADPSFLLVALGAYLVGLVLRTVRWSHLLPAPAAGGRVPPRRILPVMMVGYLGNAVLPARLGEAIRAYLIARRESLPFGGAAGSVVLERIVDTATLAVLAFVASASLGNLPWLVQGAALAAVVGIGVVLMLATTGLAPLLPVARLIIGWLPIGERRLALNRTAEQFVMSSGGAHRRPAVLIAALLSLGAWLTDAVVFWLVGRSLGIDLSLLGALLVTAVTVLATAIPSAPGYLGTFELAAVTAVGALGVAGAPALAFAVLAHVMAIGPSAVGGALALTSLGGGLRAISRAAVEQRRGAAMGLASGVPPQLLARDRAPDR